MIQKSFNLLYIYWRKFFSKGDFFTIGVILFIFIFCLVGIYQTYEKNHHLLFVFLLIPITHHFGRNDFSLLQKFSNWRKIIFLEYFFNIFPILLIFSFKLDFLYASLCLFTIGILVFLSQKSFKISYPFDVFDPFWVISFRKYKLIFLLPVIIFLIIMGKIYKNENLALFSFFLATIIGSIPYFDREFIAHILTAKFKGKKYLEKQIICGIKNFSIVFIPVFSLNLFFFNWKIAFLGLFSFLLVLLVILTKYTFFENPLVQSIVFIMIIGGYAFGLPLICLPFLYYKAVKKLENVTNQYR